MAKHNLAFLSSDHASKLFKVMFPDSRIGKSFARGRTKAAAVITEALAPHFHAKTVSNLSNPFSILLDESNDRVDKSCSYHISQAFGSTSWECMHSILGHACSKHRNCTTYI